MDASVDTAKVHSPSPGQTKDDRANLSIEQAYSGLRWSNLPRAAELTYLIIPPFDPDSSFDIMALSCSEDMRVLAEFTDMRKLHLAPGLRPTRFSTSRWMPEWERIKDSVNSFSVYSVVEGEPMRIGLPINDTAHHLNSMQP